jgi:Zn-dependent protease
LPENHECTRIELARTQKEETKSIIVQKQEPYEYTISYVPIKTKRRIIDFSNKEMMHLTIAALLVIGVGLSLGLFSGILMLTAFAVILTASFLLHEMAHKITAQKEGLWAEFRLTVFGAILTLISIIIPLKIISPGAVMIAGLADTGRAGKISIAGPATNMTLSTMFFALTFLFSPQYNVILALAAFYNAWMALFNLIPIGILDGLKVFAWDKRNWVLAFMVSVILLIFSYQRLNIALF